MGTNSLGTHDFSAVDCYDIKMRGERSAIFNIIPGAGESIDPALVKIKIGYNGDVKKELTLDNGITANGDGSFKATIKPADFNHNNKAVAEIYGLQNQPNEEIAIATIAYIKGLR